MGQPSAVANVLGNTSLDRFDTVIIGSGAGGSAAAYVLTSAGQNVLIIEAGDNNFPGLDDPTPGMPVPRYSNDELKGPIRLFDRQDPILEPRTFRAADTVTAQPNEDVNILNRTVGGTTIHADIDDMIDLEKVRTIGGFAASSGTNSWASRNRDRSQAGAWSVKSEGQARTGMASILLR